MKRRNPYVIVGLAVAIVAYIALTRTIEGLEVKGKEDSTPKSVSTEPPTNGMMPSIPCDVSKTTAGLWKHKGETGPDRSKYSTVLPNSSSPSDCGTKCCSDNKCTAFVHNANGNYCWLYYDELDTLEPESGNHPDFSKGSVDRTGGLAELTNKLSGGLTQTMSSVSGVLGSSLSAGAIIGIILAVLAIGIPIAVYAYKTFFGGKSIAATSVPIGNTMTRMSRAVAK